GRGVPHLSAGALEARVVEHVIDRLRGHVAALASDECEGRAAGTPGGRKARGLVTGWLEETGLEPAGENGFLQPIPSIGGANVLGRVPVPGEGRHILIRSEEHTSELQSREKLVCRLLLG